MKQAMAFLLAIFRPLGALVSVLRVIMEWRAHIDSVLADAEGVRDLRDTAQGRMTMETATAFGEHWINIIIGARSCEISGMRRPPRFHIALKGWAPARARSWPELMQRYRRLCASFATIERAARRRAARMMRACTQHDTAIAVRDDDLTSHPLACEPAFALRIRAPPLP